MDTGYRDILINVILPNAHMAEIQLNMRDMYCAKDKGAGHELYEVAREIVPLLDSEDAGLAK